MSEVNLKNVVQETTDYDKFQIMKGNRPISKTHLIRLIQSLEQNPTLAAARPILVDKKLQIIDGQHRLEASRSLGMPVYYIIAANTDISTARLLNTVQRGWRLTDYLASYVATGSPHYVKLAKLLEEYPIALRAMISYCTGHQKRNVAQQFKLGDFKVMKDEELLLYRLDCLRDLSTYVEFWAEDRISLAFLRVVSNDHYDHGRMLRKLKMTKMERQATVQDYLREFERAYNFKVQNEENLIRLY